MNHNEKIEWMHKWCSEHGAELQLEGECGFCRKCVGILRNGTYPDYEWYDNELNRLDNNGEIFIPKDAYHKHDCVAVLGRGGEAEDQLYEWLRWFDENGFVIESGYNPTPECGWGYVELALGKDQYHRMVKSGVK